MKDETFLSQIKEANLQEEFTDYLNSESRRGLALMRKTETDELKLDEVHLTKFDSLVFLYEIEKGPIDQNKEVILEGLLNALKLIKRATVENIDKQVLDQTLKTWALDAKKQAYEELAKRMIKMRKLALIVDESAKDLSYHRNCSKAEAIAVTGKFEQDVKERIRLFQYMIRQEVGEDTTLYEDRFAVILLARKFLEKDERAVLTVCKKEKYRFESAKRTVKLLDENEENEVLCYYINRFWKAYQDGVSFKPVDNLKNIYREFKQNVNIESHIEPKKRTEKTQKDTITKIEVS